ncbi:hypothetical protein HAX54_050748 [Datura stramonium]|uniref:Cation/H+ exchanger transmembrane domain-containing protein n=1 Tax=Datura stramonium TaxID=4076 RepID=A0ABS8SXC6_DATST|nr:hypothetical protein [Datura stramonium]
MLKNSQEVLLGINLEIYVCVFGHFKSSSCLHLQLFDLSGILTVFFCGIVMSHYTWHNVTTNSKVSTEHAFATLSFIAEVFIFLYVGMDALDMENRFVKVRKICWSKRYSAWPGSGWKGMFRVPVVSVIQFSSAI